MDNEEKNEQVEEQIEENETEELDEEEFTYTVDNNNINNDYNKKYENNSYIYVFVGFIILLIIIITLVVVVNKKNKKASGYSDVETRMVSAAKKYYEKYPDQLPKMENIPMSIDAEKLIQNSFLKPFTEMVDKNVECTGLVKVYKSDDVYSYFPYLNCGTNYKSIKLKDKIIEDSLVTDGDGLYRTNNEYVFRGELPNNYVKFNEKIWRIIKINDDGSIKLMLVEKKPEKFIWDDRYNNERKSKTGKNDFGISRIVETLKKAYEENKYVNKDNKELLIKKNWCIGKNSENAMEIENINICDKTYDNLYIGLLTIDEPLISSLDETCIKTYDGSCTNYNYFTYINVGWTLTANSDKTDEVFIVDQASLDIKKTSYKNIIRPVININTDVLYKTGDGTENTPYVIGK